MTTNSRLYHRPPLAHHEPPERAAEILFALFGKGRHSLTPEVVRRELIAPNVAVELSRGTVNRAPLYGVAVVVRRLDGTVYGLTKRAGPPVCGGAFKSAREAVAHIAAMRHYLKDHPAPEEVKR